MAEKKTPTDSLSNSSDITISEAAKKLNLSKSGVYKLIYGRKLGHYRTGPKSIRIPPVELEKFRERSFIPALNDF